jgi:uncharacterized protein involved in response to NO
MAIPRIGPASYPAIRSYGFRPLCLVGALCAGVTNLFWPLSYGHSDTAGVFAPIDRHTNETLFAYTAAIPAGRAKYALLPGGPIATR